MNCYEAKVERTMWQGEDAVSFSAGGFEALMIPKVGANVIELKNVKRGLSLLRTPDNIKTLKEFPVIFGIPVLFPPNRICDGIFTAGGKEYHYPVNEAFSHNHIHGFLNNKNFTVIRMDAKDGEAEVEAVFKNDSSTDFYRYLPHDFEFTLIYNLSCEGLKQYIKIKNMSKEPMPMGLGFHTCLKVPFCDNSSADDCRLFISVGEEWELDRRMLPTGKFLPLNDVDSGYREGGVKPQGFRISGHYTAKPIEKDGKPFHGAMIEDKSTNLRLVYAVGNGFKHWMTWNNTGDNNFVCPEPQTWAVNAPNIGMPEEVTGFKMLSPGEVWEDSCMFYVEEMQ